METGEHPLFAISSMLHSTATSPITMHPAFERPR